MNPPMRKSPTPFQPCGWKGGSQAARLFSSETTSLTMSARLLGSCSWGQNCLSKALTSATGRAESWSLTCSQVEASVMSCLVSPSWYTRDSAARMRQVFGVSVSGAVARVVRDTLGVEAAGTESDSPRSASIAARTSARNLVISACRRNSCNSLWSASSNVPVTSSDFLGRPAPLLFFSFLCFFAFLRSGVEEEEEGEDEVLLFFLLCLFFLPFATSSTSISIRFEAAVHTTAPVLAALPLAVATTSPTWSMLSPTVISTLHSQNWKQQHHQQEPAKAVRHGEQQEERKGGGWAEHLSKTNFPAGTWYQQDKQASISLWPHAGRRED